MENLAERTPPANEPKGPWGTLEIHESWFLPHEWIKPTRIWANYTSLERAQFSKQNIQITFFVWGPRGPDRALWKFGPNGEAPTIFFNFRLYSLHGHWKNLAERTPPANEPKGPWGPLEIHESWFLPHGWIKPTRIWAKYTSLERAQFPKQNIQIPFLFGAPGAQIGPFENWDPTGRPLRFSLNFVYTVYMAIEKIWLKEPHRQMSPRALRAPRNSWIMVFAPWMNQTNKNLGKLYIIGKSSVFQTKYTNNFFVWGPIWALSGPIGPYFQRALSGPLGSQTKKVIWIFCLENWALSNDV